MAVDIKYVQGPGGFYDSKDGSGPYSVNSGGVAFLIGGAGGGGGSGSGDASADNQEAMIRTQLQISEKLGAMDSLPTQNPFDTCAVIPLLKGIHELLLQVEINTRGLKSVIVDEVTP